MTDFSTTSGALTKPKIGFKSLSKKSLWMIAVLANASIWALALTLLQFLKPSYLSQGAMIIPGVGTQGNLALPGFGAGSANNKEGQSPYSYLLKIDPRQNYQYIGMSDTVLSQAAKAMNMSLEEFGEPIIILGEGTTIIEFSLEGKSAQEAQQKSQVFYETLVNHTNYLRTTQLNYQKETTQRTIESSRDNVRVAQNKLSQFREKSALKVSGQIDRLGDQLEDLRLNRINLLSQKEATESRLRNLERSLNISAFQASEALLVRDDIVLQENLISYNSSLKNIQELNSFFTANSPQVIEEKKKLNAIEQVIVTRGLQLLNRPVTIQSIERLNFSGGRKQLVELLITLQTDKEGLENQIYEIDRQIIALEIRLTTLVKEQPILNSLEQDVQLSESILVSDVAKLKLDKPELATAYPVLQLLSEPSLPEEPEGNLKKMVILGAVAFSLLLTTGILIFWWETPTRQK